MQGLKINDKIQFVYPKSRADDSSVPVGTEITRIGRVEKIGQNHVTVELTDGGFQNFSFSKIVGEIDNLSERLYLP